MDRKRKASIPSILFRCTLAAIGLLTAFGASKGIRYALCGVLLVIVVVEPLWAWRRRSTGGREFK